MSIILYNPLEKYNTPLTDLIKLDLTVAHCVVNEHFARYFVVLLIVHCWHIIDHRCNTCTCKLLPAVTKSDNDEWAFPGKDHISFFNTNLCCLISHVIIHIITVHRTVLQEIKLFSQLSLSFLNFPWKGTQSQMDTQEWDE